MVGRNQYGYITVPSQGPHGGERAIWLHHPCLRKVPMVGRNQYGYITQAKSVDWGSVTKVAQKDAHCADIASIQEQSHTKRDQN